MLIKEQWMQIHVLKTQGLSLRELAHRLGVSSRNTLLLAPHVDALFDAGLMTVNREGELRAEQ
jgi:hypothetical protein